MPDTKVKRHIKPKVKPEMGEVATINRDVTRTLIFGGVLENLDDTLRTRGRGKGLKIYDELERDTHAFAVLQKRKLAVSSRPWQVVPASESALDKQAGELVERQLKALNFDALTADLLDATLKGYAVGEVMWEVRENELAVKRVIAREQRRFVFSDKYELRMLTRERLWDGEELPPMKFVVHSQGAKDGSPYGLGLGHKLFWPVFFKKQDISFWLVFADKFGSPTGLGKYPAGAPKTDQDKLLAALSAIAQDAGIIIPQGMEVELLEAARAGSIDTYEKLARYMDEQISECVLGETITTTAKSTGLGSGVADKQNDVRLEIAKADADLLSATLNGSLVRWIVDYNVPGAGYPQVWRVFEEEEDLEHRSTIDKNLHEMGYEYADVQQVEETYGGKWKKKAAAPMPRPGAQPPLQPGAEFAEPAVDQATADQRTLEEAAGELVGAWREDLGPRVDELIAMAESTGDLVTFRERLADVMKAQPSPALVRRLERSAFSAQLLGRTTGAAGTVELAEPRGKRADVTIAVDSPMQERLADVIEKSTEANTQFAEILGRSVETLGAQHRQLGERVEKAIATVAARPQPRIQVVLPPEFTEAVDRQADSNERFLEGLGRQLAAWQERLIEAFGKLTRPRTRKIELPDGRIFKSTDEEVK